MPRPTFDYAVAHHLPVAHVVVHSRGRLWELRDDLIAINRVKNIGNATGSFSVQLVDRIGSDGLTWQERIQTGDDIIIYEANAPTKPVKVLRGVCVNAQRIFSISTTGGPDRYTQINGYDMGYVFTWNQIRYLWPIDPTAIVGTKYQLDANFGLNVGPFTPTQFLDDAVSILVNGNAYSTLKPQHPLLEKFQTKCDLPNKYQINLINVQAFTGQLWNLFDYYMSSPIAELFYVDLPDAPMLYYRQPPYMDLSGAMLGVFTAPSATLPDVTVRLVDKQNHALGRSANEMYAFYMTYSDQVTLTQSASFNYAPFFGGAAKRYASAAQGAITSSVGVDRPSNPIYDKTIEARYGFQPLNINTPFISSLTAVNPSLNPVGWASVAVPINTWAYHVFRHTDQMESGTITVHGDEAITIGRYAYIPEWGMKYYVQGLTDQFVQYGTWQMTLQVVRGYPYGNAKPVIFGGG